jgi:hypothetical protein
VMVQEGVLPYPLLSLVQLTSNLNAAICGFCPVGSWAALEE